MLFFLIATAIPLITTSGLYTVADPEFPRQGDANLKRGSENILFGQFFPERCMKMREIGPTGGVPGAPLDLPQWNQWKCSHYATATSPTDI